MGSKLCEICGKRAAKYVCQECGRNVCEICLEPHTWLCLDCHGRIEREASRTEAEGILPFSSSFVKIFLLGFILIFIGTVMLMIAALTSGVTHSFGFFLLIGFIPILFGAGQYSLWAILLAIVLAVISLVFFIVTRRQKESGVSAVER